MTPMPIVVRVAAVLVATLVVVGLSRLATAIAAVPWWPFLPHPITAGREVGHHGHASAVIAPRSAISEPPNVPVPCRRGQHGLGPPNREVLHRLFRFAISQTVAIGGDFGTIRATFGALYGRNQRAAAVFCTRL